MNPGPADNMRPISAIVVHCSYTPPGMDIGVAEIRDWHVNGNGWNDVGYHYVIRRSGQVETGRSEHIAGAHVAGHNGNTIGVCLVGGKRGDEADCNFTRAQWRALESLMGALTGRYKSASVKGHRDFTAAKECPCFDVEAWWLSR